MKARFAIVSLVAAAFLLVCSLSAFAGAQQEKSSTQSATNTTSTVKIWLGMGNTNNISAYNQLVVAPFNASQTKYKAEAELVQHGDQQLRLALSAGKGPDIVFTAGPSVLLTFSQNGLVIPLDSYAAKYGWNKLFIPSMLGLERYQGKLYGLPDEYESMFLYYNKTLFEQNGWSPPKTLADVEQIAKAAKAKGITPLAAGNADWKGVNEWYVTVFLNHYAGAENVYKALSGKLAWNSPVFVKAIEMLNNWWQNGWFDHNYYSLTIDQAVNNLATGKAAMELTGSWGVNEMLQWFGKSKQQWDWVPIPAFTSNAAYPLYELGIGGTNSINKYSKDPAGSAAFLNYIYQPKNFLRWTAAQPGTGLLFPPEKITTSDLKSVSSQLDPKFIRQTLQVSDAIAKGNFGYTTWTFWPDRTEQYIINGIEKVWAKEITPQQYMDKVNQQFQADLKAGRVPPIVAPGTSGS